MTLETKRFRQILRVSCAEKKTNEWVLVKGGAQDTFWSPSNETAILRPHYENVCICLEKEMIRSTTDSFKVLKNKANPREDVQVASRTGQEGQWRGRSKWQATENSGESSFMLRSALEAMTPMTAKDKTSQDKFDSLNGTMTDWAFNVCLDYYYQNCRWQYLKSIEQMRQNYKAHDHYKYTFWHKHT